MNTSPFLSLLLLMPTFTTHAVHADPACSNPTISCRNIAPCKYKDGTLDTTFGIQGKVTTDFGTPYDTAQAVTVLPCGKIVAAGFSGDLFAGGPFSVALAGYTSYGRLDTSFGTNGTGKVLTDFAVVLSNAGVPGLTVPGNNIANALLLQRNCPTCNDSCTNTCNDCTKNCKLIIVGGTTAISPLSGAFMIARYKCDGTLDTSFGMNNSGVTVTSINGIEDVALAAALQKDGKVIAVGYTTLPNGTRQFAIVRYNCDGSLDLNFGCDGSGIVVVNFDFAISKALAVQIQNNGKIVVGGVSGGPGLFDGPFDFALTRLNPNGTLDTSFGDNGRVLTDFASVFNVGTNSDDQITSLVLLENCNKYQDCCGNYDDSATIIAVGYSSVNDAPFHDFALAGYTNNGQLDPNFGGNNNGLVVTQLVPNADDRAFAALLEHNCNQPCKIIAAGENHDQNAANFALARYNTDGILDTQNFGTNGVTITDFTHDEDAIMALALQRNGNIIAAGGSNDKPREEGGGRNFALARYHACTSCCIQK